MNVKLVSSIDELRSVWKLTHDAYVRAGLIEPQRDGIFVHRRCYDLLDDSRLYGATTVAYLVGRRNEIAGTVSVTIDNPRGLPDEDTFPVNIGRTRDECIYYGYNLVNFWRIETELGVPRCAVGTLIDWCYDFCVANKIEVAIMTCHPRHAKFYERAMGFQIESRESSECGFESAPSVLIRWDQRKHAAIWPKHKHRFLCERWDSSNVLD